MTKIVHTIILEGEDEHVWPFNRDLKQHISLLQEQAQKEEGITMTVSQDRDKVIDNGGSRASKLGNLAKQGVKAGWDFMFKEPANETETSR